MNLPVRAMATTVLLACAMPALADYSYEIIAVPGAINTYVLGMNDRGDVVGSFNVPGSGAAYGFSRIGGVYAVETILGSTEGAVQDIDNAGRIVGTCQGPNCAGIGYVRSPTGGVQLLPRPDMQVWYPLGVNEQLQITGAASFLGVTHGFVWGPSGWTLLDMPGADFTQVRDINAAGTSVGDYYVSSGPGGGAVWGGFVHDASGYTDLTYPGATETRTWDINDRGDIVGVAVSPADWIGYVRHADGSYETLSFAGASYMEPEDINRSGQIAGYFWDGSASRGFIATPSAVPEPQAWLLMLGGLACLTRACPARRCS